MKKLLILIVFASILMSCKKVPSLSDNTESEASFMIFDKEINILSDDNQISSGKYADIEYKNSDSILVGLFHTILFKTDSKHYSLKIDYIIREDSSKVYYKNHSYSYREQNDYFVKMESLSDRFIIFPESSIIFTDTSKYVKTNLMTPEIEALKKEGLIIQLLDYTDDIVYISNLKDRFRSDYFEIKDKWIEKGKNGSEDKLYISTEFNFSLINIENADDMISIKNGRSIFWSLNI